MSRDLNADSPEVGRLLLAMGGAGRNRSVRTMMRETETRRRTGSEPLRGYQRVITHRAAPGRIRIETIPDALARPATEAAGGGTVADRPGPLLVIVRPSGSPRGGAAEVLRDARLEPRNLLAHIHESRAIIRRGGVSGADIVIELSAERAAFRFDDASGLCAVRADFRTGIVTTYHDWRFVNGINTPFFEVETPLVRAGASVQERADEVLDRFETAPGLSTDHFSDHADGSHDRGDGMRLERSLLAIAYDLPLPDALFEPIIVSR